MESIEEKTQFNQKEYNSQFKKLHNRMFESIYPKRNSFVYVNFMILI